MMTGMLWYDNSPKTNLSDKVIRAATYYHQKYGKKPDLCFVHPSMLPGQALHPAGIEIRSASQVLPNHLWLGIHETQNKTA